MWLVEALTIALVSGRLAAGVPQFLSVDRLKWRRNLSNLFLTHIEQKNSVRGMVAVCGFENNHFPDSNL